MVKLADTLDLGSSALGRGGSSPFIRISFIADLAQLVEHLICNQRVACSNHVVGIPLTVGPSVVQLEVFRKFFFL